MKSKCCFLIFWIFLPFFLKFSILDQVVRVGIRKFFSFLSRPVPTHFRLKWSMNGVFNFLNFFALFFGIFYSGSSRKDRNNNCFFSLSRPIPTRFGLKLGLNGVFLIFLPFFLEFSIQGRVGRIRTIIFFSLFLDLSQPVLAWNEAWIVHFNFLYFFAIFFFRIFYYWSGRKDQNDNFLFLSFATCPDPFWL